MAKKEVENDYRSERKKRLAKQAKKEKKSGVDSVKVVTAVITAVIVVVLVAALGFGLYQFGVPQKILPAAKVNGRTYSVAEYNYYYMNVYQTYANSASEAGYSLFDYTKDPETQMTTNEDGEEISYAQLFRDTVLSNLKTSDYYLNLAKEEGVELSEESKASIESTITEIAGYAQQNSYSASRYISLIYGKGLNLKKFRSILEEQHLVSQYMTDKTEKTLADITDKDIKAEFEKDPSAYKVADIRLFGLELPNDEDAEEGKKETKKDIEAKAAAMLARITDEASFKELCLEYCNEEDAETYKSDSATLMKGLKFSIVNTNIGEDLAKWMYSSKRVEGDKKVYTTDDYVYVIYIVKPAYVNEEPLVSARHILVSYDTIAQKLEAEDNGETKDSKNNVASDGTKVDVSNTSYDAKVILAAYEEAKRISDEYKAGEQTEEAFAALADQYSADTASTGENGSGGGLYANIERGQMVTAFENWVYNDKRETGDTGIVQTEYGYHIMYFVGRADEAPWKAEIRTTLGNQILDEQNKEIEEKIGDNAAEAAFGSWAYNEAIKLVNKLYVNNGQ